MAIKVGIFFIHDINFGKKAALNKTTLIVNKKRLASFLADSDDRIQAVNIAPAKPGDSTRILCVKDVIQPWCKIKGEKTGQGLNHILNNVAVVTCGKIVGFQEGIIDMSGPGVQYTPFSRTLNVVIEVKVRKGIEPHQHEEAVRNAGLKAAKFLGEITRFETPNKIKIFDNPDKFPVTLKLPRIAYLYMLLSQGLLHDTYVLGGNVREECLPRTIEPHMLFDNAIVSGNCVSACDKNTTWHHQNNPVLQELYKRHGNDLNFIGVVLTNEPVRLAAKEKSAQKAVELLKNLNIDGVVISKEGFGNPDADLMMLTRGLEKAGIKTVSITDEFPGPDGRSQSLADGTPEANGMISTGNANESIVLPPMEILLGPVKDLSKLAGAYPQSLKKDGSLEIELQGIIGATNELGMQTLRCREI